MDVEELIRRASDDLEAAEAQLRAAEGRVNELRAIRDGLKFALQRYGHETAGTQHVSIADSEVVRVVDQQVQVTQTDIVFSALATFGRPAKTQEVHAKLEAAGHEYEFEQVRSTLGYLLRKGRIKRVGKALWEVPADSPSQEDFTPAAGTAGVSTAGENGNSSQRDVLTRADLFSQPAR